MLTALARTATRRPLTVMLLWGLFLLLGFGLGTGVFARLSDNVPEVPGTESESAAQYLDELDPAGSSITGVVAGTPVSEPGLRAEVGAQHAPTAPWSRATARAHPRRTRARMRRPIQARVRTRPPARARPPSPVSARFAPIREVELP
ncbi:hypothetical protein SALBM217S_01541 [Streptomyces griseoloalbus]